MSAEIIAFKQPRSSRTKRRSAMSRVRRSGLVRRKPRKGKLASEQDYARMKFKQWKRDPKLERALSGDRVNQWGIAARLAYGTMLQSRTDLIKMHSTISHEHVDELVAELSQTSEELKLIVQMLDAAYARVLAAACAHKAAGGKFKMRPRQRRLIWTPSSISTTRGRRLS